MLHKLRITRRALAQFQSVCDYLVDEFGERVADDFELEVEECLYLLMRFPERGHIELTDRKYVYRSRIVGEYNKMYYFIDKNTLVVAAIVDMRMHPDNVMKAVLGKK